MLDSPGCKGCSATVYISAAEIDKALAVLKKSKNTKFVDEETYEFRLNQCKSCKFFEYGTTCLKCGCVVQIRAKLAKSSCPYVKKPKW